MIFHYIKIRVLNSTYHKYQEIPRSLINKKVKIKGEIKRKEQITQFNKDQTQLELYVPGLSPTPYIIVTYGTTTPYNVGDIIEVYGEYNYPLP